MLNQINDLINDLNLIRKHADPDLEEILKLQEEIAERSSRYYELVP